MHSSRVLFCVQYFVPKNRKLSKDSNRSSRLGEYKGYYFWRGDFIKLKMLSFTVHKDMLEGLLN